MHKIAAVVVGVMTTLGWSGASLAADPAQTLCDTFEVTGLLSEPCKIDHLTETISVTLDMATAAEARKVCPTARQIVDFGAGSGWSLKIFSPYSGDRPLATCRL